jgi:hypothetical protein
VARAVASRYSILIPDKTMARAADYLHALQGARSQPGVLFRDRLEGADLQTMTQQDLLAELFDTKCPQIFAQTAVAGDGSDWSLPSAWLCFAPSQTASPIFCHWAPGLLAALSTLRAGTVKEVWILRSIPSSFLETIPPFGPA